MVSSASALPFVVSDAVASVASVAGCASVGGSVTSFLLSPTKYEPSVGAGTVTLVGLCSKTATPVSLVETGAILPVLLTVLYVE